MARVGESVPDVVIVGAGLAGMTAAYELSDRELVILESRDRVGGRTLSGTHGDYWYNSGAQFVWDGRTLDLCRRIGVDVLDARGARASLYLRDRLVQGSNPYTMFMKLPLSVRERLDLGRTITKLRRLATRMHDLDAAQLDASSLSELMGPVTPVTRAVMNVVCEGGTGLSTDDVSGWIGLGYTIHLFGGNVNDTLKQVVGGTQAITKTIAASMDPNRIMLESRVLSVEAQDDGVLVRYRRAGRSEQLNAKACIVATTADSVLETVKGLPPAKREALGEMVPYGKIVSGAWLTDEPGPMPWDDLLMTPVVADMSFEQLSNNGFFVHQLHKPRREPGGVLVTLATGPRAEKVWDLDDEATRRLQLADLSRMYPLAASVLAGAETRIERWRGFPGFRKGWLSHQRALREPLGGIHFCGDYTAQPGTPGAVGSGYHVARAVERALDASARRLRESRLGAPEPSV
jgi:protoporphyrinogen/coproporphyrinogen III oxidase